MKAFFKEKLWPFLKKYYNYILFGVVAVVTIYIIYRQVDIRELQNVLKRANYFYLFSAFAFLFLYWLMESFMLQVLIRFEYPDETLKHSFSLMMIGQYYNQVTPSSSGGQPLQLIDMVDRGINAGFATAVLVQKYAFYQLSVTIVGIIGLIANFSMIFTWPPIGRVLLYIGLAVNLAGSILIVLVALIPETAKHLLTFIANLAYKIRLIKDKQKWLGRIDSFISDYTMAMKGLKTRIPETIGLLIFNIIAILVYYAITFFIYRALGFSERTMTRIILIQSVLYLMIAFVPLPGATGGAEIGFAIVFGVIFGAAESSIALIVWRFITFYFILAFGGIFLAVRSLIMGKKPQKKLKAKTSHEKD